MVGLWSGLVAGLLHGAFYVFGIAPLINAAGHWRGKRHFDNSAFNSRLLAWFTGGESLHNNHHAHPRSPKFSVRRSEFDPSWPIICSLADAGLLVVVGSPIAGDPSRRASDDDPRRSLRSLDEGIDGTSSRHEEVAAAPHPDKAVHPFQAQGSGAGRNREDTARALTVSE